MGSGLISASKSGLPSGVGVRSTPNHSFGYPQGTWCGGVSAWLLTLPQCGVLVGAAPGIDECAQPLIQPSQGFYPFRALQFFVLCCQVVNWAVACRKRRQKCGCCKVLRRLCCLKCDAAFVVDVAQGAVRLHRLSHSAERHKWSRPDVR
jgi:hypothetical protein